MLAMNVLRLSMHGLGAYLGDTDHPTASAAAVVSQILTLMICWTCLVDSVVNHSLSLILKSCYLLQHALKLFIARRLFILLCCLQSHLSIA